MPTFTSIAINDGESTPVTHTFTPRLIENGVWEWANSDGVRLGDEIITGSLRETATKTKSRWSLVMPVTVSETINGVVREVYERGARVDLTFTFDESTTSQERKNLRVLLADLLADSSVISVIDDREPVYGG